jgi:outer membrane protein assembly factor BamB
MTTKATLTTCVCVLALFGLLLAPGLAAPIPARPGQAQQILAATGVKGGLVVHLGCGDGKLTAALRANDSYLVQGLDADAGNIEKARQHLHALRLYGPVSVEQWLGARLPYNDNLVNLVVAEDLRGVAMAEVLRVLAPGGVAYIQKGGHWMKTVKPRPAEIDQWTHYLHDPSNNAVAHDAVVGPPRRLQWIGGPRYSRHHDHMSSISAMVSANGRNFYIFDEATRASILVPPKWWLVARDAFNGTILWKRPIEDWQTHLWPLKSGPQLLTRRLVAIGDRVYVTLGLSAPLVALDAATGATVRTYQRTAATEEILCEQGILFLVVNPRLEPKFASLQEAREGAKQAWPDEGKRRIVVVQADTGKTVWEKEDRVLPETLTVKGGRVFYHDGEKIVCLSGATGARNWASPPLSRKSLIQSYFTPTLVAYKDVVLFSGGIDNTDYGGGHSPILGLSAADGSILWKAEQPPCGHHTPKDILVANGLVWYGEVAQTSDSGEMTARDPQTGKVVKQFLPDTHVPWFHHRCYRAKATDNYLLFSRTGIECIDTTTNHWTPNNWVRGGCLYGIMPCNGLIYSPPNPCACYEETKLYGFNALAPELKTPLAPVADQARLEPGPAYSSASNPQSLIPNPSDWPTYRCDAARSGSTKTPVPTELKSVWQADLGGRLSSVVVADGKLFLSSLDTDTIQALDAATGKPVWSYTAGGRVDSPPTIWQGRALFGCADGYVYCLRAADGKLAWRLLAAPEDRRLVAFDRVESVWPVSGSVLVQDGVVYCVAGRSMFLDGGLRMLRLDAQTGRKLSETVLDDRDPESKENLQSKAKGMNMPVALPDVLSCDGRWVYMRSLPLDLQGKRKFVEYVPVTEQKGDDVHLFSPTGFLDDTMWHRTYWVYGRAWASAAGGYYQAGRLVPAGRIMVFDDTTVWGYGRRWQYFRWSTPYVNHLFAAKKQAEILQMVKPEPMTPEAKKKGSMGKAPLTRFAYQWSDDLPVQACAMVHAGATLFVAGPPNFVDEEEAAKSMDDPNIRAKLIEQGAAYDGRKGAILAAVSAADGKGLLSYRLASMPVFDGMAAAGGRLYLSTTDGKVLCLGGGEGKPLELANDVAVKVRPPEADKPLTTTPVTTPPGKGKKKRAASD